MARQAVSGSQIPYSRRQFLRLTASLGSFGFAPILAPDRRLGRTAMAQDSQLMALIDLSDNTWTSRRPPPFPGSPAAAYGSKHMRLTYNSDRHVIYLWGGDYCVSYDNNNRCASHEEVWSYDVGQDRWQLLLSQTTASTSGFPRGRCVPGMAYDPKRKVVWMTSGQERYDNYDPNLRSGGLWAFDPALRIWLREGPSPENGESSKVDLPSDSAEYMAYDPVSDGLFAPTRIGALQCRLADMTLRDGVSNDNWSASWSPIGDDPTIGTLSFAVDTRRNRAVLYLPYQGETWSYDFATKQSSRLTRQTLPAKSIFGMVYDSANDVAVLFAGYSEFEGWDGARPLNQLWVFDFAKNAWSRPALAGRPPSPRQGNQIIYDPFNNVIIQFGGTGGYDPPPADENEVFLLRLNLGKVLPDTAPPSLPTSVYAQ